MSRGVLYPSVVTSGSTRLVGVGMFGVRLVPLVMMSLTTVLVVRTLVLALMM